MKQPGAGEVAWCAMSIGEEKFQAGSFGRHDQDLPIGYLQTISVWLIHETPGARSINLGDLIEPC